MTLARRYINRAKVLEDAETITGFAKQRLAGMKTDDPKRQEGFGLIEEFEEALHAILDDDEDDEEPEDESEDTEDE